MAWGLVVPSREPMLGTSGAGQHPGRACLRTPGRRYTLRAMRNFTRYHSALMPSRQLIFLPSA